MNYEELMLRAITKANKFKYTAKPNPVVGAIIIQGSEIISEGYHEIYGKNHAEINAIEEAQKHLGKKFENFSDYNEEIFFQYSFFQLPPFLTMFDKDGF